MKEESQKPKMKSNEEIFKQSIYSKVREIFTSEIELMDLAREDERERLKSSQPSVVLPSEEEIYKFLYQLKLNWDGSAKQIIAEWEKYKSPLSTTKSAEEISRLEGEDKYTFDQVYSFYKFQRSERGLTSYLKKDVFKEKITEYLNYPKPLKQK